MGNETEGHAVDSSDRPQDVVRFANEEKFGDKKLFKPPKSGRLSVCVALERSLEELTDIGGEQVPLCCGYARTPSEIYSEELKLVVVRDDDPYLGHANVEMPIHDVARFRNAINVLKTKSRWVRFSDAPASAG